MLECCAEIILNFNCLACLFGMRFFSAILAWGLVVVFFLISAKQNNFSSFLFKDKLCDLNTILGNFPSSTFDQLWKEIPAKSQCPSKTFMVLVSYNFSLFYHRGRDMGVGVGVVNWPLNGLDRLLSSTFPSFVFFFFFFFGYTVFLSQRWILFVVTGFYHYRHLVFGLLSLVAELSLQLGRASLGPFKLLNA